MMRPYRAHSFSCIPNRPVLGLLLSALEGECAPLHVSESPGDKLAQNDDGQMKTIIANRNGKLADEQRKALQRKWSYSHYRKGNDRMCYAWRTCSLAIISLIAYFAYRADAQDLQWWMKPKVKSTMHFEVGGMYCLPHYMNKDADDRFLLVNMGANIVNQPVMLYDFQGLLELPEETSDNGIAIASANPTILFQDGTSRYRFKGGAVSSRNNIAIPGLAGTAMCVYNSLLTTNASWVAGRTATWIRNDSAFCVEAPPSMGADGLDFSTDGRFLYSNVYGNNNNQIVKWSYNSLTSTHEANQLTVVKQFSTGLYRVRNISLYKINDRELIFFGEGGRSDTSARVCVLDVTDENDWRQFTLIDAPDLFLNDIMNVKVSGEDTTSPVLYVCTDDGRMQIFGLDRDGLSLKSSTPLKTFDVDELSELRGCMYGTVNFRNFEVSRDGAHAFFLNDSRMEMDVTNLFLRVVCADAAGFADIWGAWSTEGTQPYVVPSAVATWDELSRTLWQARDAYVRAGSRTEIPPSEEPVVLSLGAISIPDSLIASCEPIAVDIENDVPVWRLRVFEDTVTRSMVAVLGNTAFTLSSLPLYLENAWVDAVYGTPPSWLDAEETKAWYAARSRSRIEWFVTLVSQSYWTTYCANRSAEAESAQENDELALVIKDLVVDDMASIHSVSVRSIEPGETRLWSKDSLSNTNWTYNGYSLQASGTTAAGVHSVGNQLFVMATFSATAVDSDGDGIPDEMEEKVYGTNPDKADSSGDGISDWEKAYRYDLNPRVQDTAGDGISDDERILSGADPRVSLTTDQKAAALRSIRYTYDDDDRLTGTFFGLGGASIKTELTPAGNPVGIRNRNAAN